jgi:hypothetical protein
MMKKIAFFAVVAIVLAGTAFAQEAAATPGEGSRSAAEELARKLQDPLANLRVLNTENNFDFGTGNEELSATFFIQPVYAISREKLNIVLRGVIPLVGLAPEAQKPVVGDPLPPGTSDLWGLADSQFMAFFSPKSKSKFKWGGGPLISAPTHTDSKLSGAKWGAGPALIGVGTVGSQWTYAVIGTQVWGQDGYSTSNLQPMLFYNIPGTDGWAINYNAMWAYNHDANKGDRWTIPLGLSVSKPWVLKSGHAIDASIGAYINVVKPDGAADWTFRWTIGLVFP